MSCEFCKVKITDGSFSVEEFLDVDTKKHHDLIIYRYAINGDFGYNVVIGEVLNGSVEAITYLEKLMCFRLNHVGLQFIFGNVKLIKDMNILKNIKLSCDGYKLLFQSSLYDTNIENIMSNNLKTIVVDPLTKRFSSISDNENPFNTLEYYEEKQELEDECLLKEKTKYLKKAVNY